MSHDEQDRNKGACEFEKFFAQAPDRVYKPPLSLFKEIAIPIFSNHAYRAVSLKRICMKLGATAPKWRIFGLHQSIPASAAMLHRIEEMQPSVGPPSVGSPSMIFPLRPRRQRNDRRISIGFGNLQASTICASIVGMLCSPRRNASPSNNELEALERNAESENNNDDGDNDNNNISRV